MIQKKQKNHENCYKVLKKKGILMIWWSNPSYDKIKPHKLKNYKLFTPISLAGIKGDINLKEM